MVNTHSHHIIRQSASRCSPYRPGTAIPSGGRHGARPLDLPDGRLPLAYLRPPNPLPAHEDELSAALFDAGCIGFNGYSDADIISQHGSPRHQRIPTAIGPASSVSAVALSVSSALAEFMRTARHGMS